MPRFIAYQISMFLLLLMVFSVLKTAFVINFWEDELSLTELLQALWMGMRFDIRLIIYILAPVLLLSWLPFLNPFKGKWRSKIWQLWYALTLTAIIFVYLVDFGHYAYKKQHVNFSIFEFINTRQDLAVAWETYPMGWGFLFLGCLAGAIYFFTGYVQRRLQPLRTYSWWLNVLLFSAVLSVYYLGERGNFDRWRLRWSNAYTVSKPFFAAIALNPVLYAGASYLKAGALTVDYPALNKYYPIVRYYLGLPPETAPKPTAEQTSNNQRDYDFKRVIEPASTPLGHGYNVVLIMLESLAAHRMGLFGNPLQATPNFDALGRNGWFFPNFYAPRAGTAPAMFATLFGVPDVAMSISRIDSSTHNPLAIDHHSIINCFSGYDKSFFTGVSATWGHMRAVLKNIDGLQVFDRANLKAEASDVWGVQDLDMLLEANDYMQNDAQQPFFTILMTGGNHEPYARIPKNNMGFKPLKADQELLEQYSFRNLDELNALAYIDHSLGKYFEAARNSNYFDKTIFVLFGDHGVGSPNKDAPLAYRRFDLSSHRVFFTIYAPGLLEAQTLHQVASEIDILPTLASLMGVPSCTNQTLGRNILAVAPELEGAFIASTQTGRRTLAFIQGDLIFYNSPELSGVFNYQSNSLVDLREEYPRFYMLGNDLTAGIYEASNYMILNGNR